MSRTYKDTPAARKARRARRLTDAGLTVAKAAPEDADLWAAYADPGRSNRARQAAAIELGLLDPQDAGYGLAPPARDPETSGDPGTDLGERLQFLAHGREVERRTLLTGIANGF